MGVLRTAWEVLSSDGFWSQVKGVSWSRTEVGARVALRLDNPSLQEVELVGVILRQAPAEGSHGIWRPAERLVLTAWEGEPTILEGPVLRPAEQTRVRPRAEWHLMLPETVPPTVVDSVVLTALFQDKAVKQWRLDEHGGRQVLRDDKIHFGGPADIVGGVLNLIGLR